MATPSRRIYQRAWWRVAAATTKTLLTKFIGENVCLSYAHFALLVLLGQLGIRTHQQDLTTFHDLVVGERSIS